EHRLELELSDDGSVVERRLVRAKDGLVLSRETVAQPALGEAADPSVLAPSLERFVVLDVPARTPGWAHAHHERTPAEQWPHAAAQLAWSELRAGGDARGRLLGLVAAGDRRLGLYVL